MATTNYGLHTIDYGVTGWDAIMTTDMELIDKVLFNNSAANIITHDSEVVVYDGEVVNWETY